MPIKYSSVDTVIPFEGLRVMLHAGEAWDANDPVVKERPGLFTDEPTKVRRSTPYGIEISDVEQATAGPGEKRAAKRPAKR